MRWTWWPQVATLEDAVGLVELEHLGGQWWVWRLSQTGQVIAVVEAARV